MFAKECEYILSFTISKNKEHVLVKQIFNLDKGSGGYQQSQ